MGNRRDALLLAAVLMGLAVLALLVRPHAARTDAGDLRASTFRYGPEGAAALYHLARELDVPAHRLLRSWSVDRDHAVLVVLQPVERALPAEAASLLAWIEAGGTLIYAPAPFDGLAPDLGLRTVSVRPGSLPPLEAVRWDGISAFPEEHDWTAGIDSVPGFRTVFSARSERLQQPDTRVLLRTEEGAPALLTFPMGQGRVLAFSDAAVLANRRLREGGAAIIFARAAAAALADGGRLSFDEYHQGFREAGTWRTLWRFLTGHAVGRVLLQAGAAALALLLLYGVRFGGPLPETGSRRRSPLEHAQALASGYQRAHARGVSRRLLMRGLERRLGRRVLGTGGALHGAALEASPAGRRVKQEWERGEDGDLVALAGAIDDFVVEVRRWK
jgi:hypothetical protein